MLVLELEKSSVKQIGETKVEHRGKDTVFPAYLILYICYIIQILKSKDLKVGYCKTEPDFRKTALNYLYTRKP